MFNGARTGVSRTNAPVYWFIKTPPSCRYQCAVAIRMPIAKDDLFLLLRRYNVELLIKAIKQANEFE